jgi:Zn-dependent M28 family amino/carboxypeptidase
VLSSYGLKIRFSLHLTTEAAEEPELIAKITRTVLNCALCLVLLPGSKGWGQDVPRRTGPQPQTGRVSRAIPANASFNADFNEIRAFKYTREVTAFGPRPIGSANHKKLEDYVLAHLKGDQVEDDAFIADTPEGKFPVRNLIAKFPGKRDGIIVIAGHYDTNYPLRDTGYVGANDGGSSTAMLLELANAFRGEKREGYSIWLVWTDGEEAVKSWTSTDGLYGTRHLAEKWQKDGTLKSIKAFLLVDMIADADLNIDRDSHSTAWLEDLVYEAATHMGYQSHFFNRTLNGLVDDHLPFADRGVPSADLIDLDYGYGNVFHHTTEDTMDKLSPKSMEIVGRVVLDTVRMLDKK